MDNKKWYIIFVLLGLFVFSIFSLSSSLRDVGNQISNGMHTVAGNMPDTPNPDSNITEMRWLDEETARKYDPENRFIEMYWIIERHKNVMTLFGIEKHNSGIGPIKIDKFAIRY